MESKTRNGGESHSKRHRYCSVPAEEPGEAESLGSAASDSYSLLDRALFGRQPAMISPRTNTESYSLTQQTQSY